jgi:uncharacterized RDD family membrane protein YckC
MTVTDDVHSPSVAPPGWTPGGGGLYVPPGASVAVGEVAPSRAAVLEPADAAVRWRLRAARIDNLIVSAGYLVICGLERWNPALPTHLLLLSALGVAYHFAFEARDGRTPGKRRAGIRVVALDGRPAGLRAIAVRSALRAIDGLPLLYASGLVSMLRTGPARRQRIGDVAAGTKVIAVDGLAAARGTPGWFLSAATLLAVLASAFVAWAAVNARTAPLSETQRAEFIEGCSAGGPAAQCECVLTQLQADGYTTFDKLLGLVEQARIATAQGRPDLVPGALARARAACVS